MPCDIQRPATLPPNRWLAGLDRTASAAVLRLRAAWRQRRELRRLAAFDDRMLRDIGVSRGDVERALASPFRHEVDPERRPRGRPPRA
jgi:uncharacterized protein YjiS (DUF1127 family)